MSESNGYISPFIGDGYDRTATIQAVPGLWSKVRFRYRPAAACEVSEAFQQASMNPSEPPIKSHAKLLAAKIVDWDIKSGDEKVKVTADNIERLHYTFYNALRAIVYGEAVAQDDETGEKHGTSEDDEKNSGKG